MSTQPSSDILRYSEFLQSIDIVRIDVLAVKAVRKPDFRRPAKGSLVISSEAKLETLTASSLNALVKTKVEGVNESEESQFTCDLDVRVSYKLARQIPGLTDDKDLVDRFVETNVTVNAWPYLREYVSWLTTSMGVGTTLLPLLMMRPPSPKGNET